MARRGVTPYRYIQLARYLIQRWIDHGPASMAAAMRSFALWKGKGRAQAAGMLGTRVALAGMDQRDSDALLRMSMELEAERRGERGSGRGSPSGGHRSGQDGQKDAGPSRLISKERSVLEPDPRAPPLPKEMYRLMNDERLFVKGAAKPPRELIVLCHGLYGFSTATPIPLFPSLKLHYWASVLEVLRDRLGAKVLVVGVKGTGSIKERAEQMHAFLKEKLPRGTGVNFVAHSMGGLDCRHLISTIKPTTYTPLSLTTIGTPHRGSPFMDWCAANIGVGAAAAAAAAAATAKAASSSAPAKLLPYSLKAPLLSRPSEEQGKKEESGWTAGLTSYLLNIFDSPAYSNLTTSFLREHFNPATPDSPNVKYTSVAGRCAKMSVMHPLWFTKLVLDAAAENGYANDGRVEGTPYEGNDGLVDVTSAKWGEFLGAVDQTHHWDLRGEGGLFPQPGSIKTGEDSDGGLFGSLQMPGSWDSGGLSEHLGLASSEAKAMAGSAIAKASAAIGSSFGTSSDSADPSQSRENVGASPSPGHRSSDAQKSTSSSSPSSSWDVAQVGQVIDWVTDLFPGDNKAAETSKKQLADAQKEKDKAAWREREIQSFTTGSGSGEERRPDGEKKKNKGSKFDLARFYGGLMLKLRDDGF